MVSVIIICWSYGEGLIIKINKLNVAQHNYDEFPPNPPNSPSNFLTDDIDIPTPNTAVQESCQEESPNHSHYSLELQVIDVSYEGNNEKHRKC